MSSSSATFVASACFLACAGPVDVLAAEAPGAPIETWRVGTYFLSILMAGILGVFSQRTTYLIGVPVTALPALLAGALVILDLGVTIASPTTLFSSNEFYLPLMF